MNRVVKSWGVGKILVGKGTMKRVYTRLGIEDRIRRGRKRLGRLKKSWEVLRLSVEFIKGWRVERTMVKY